MDFTIAHRAVRTRGYITDPTPEAKGQTLSKRKSAEMLLALFEQDGHRHYEVWVGNDFSQGSPQHTAVSLALKKMNPKAIVAMAKKKGGSLSVIEKHDLEKSPRAITQEHWNQFGERTGFTKITKGEKTLFQAREE